MRDILSQAIVAWFGYLYAKSSDNVVLIHFSKNGLTHKIIQLK